MCVCGGFDLCFSMFLSAGCSILFLGGKYHYIIEYVFFIALGTLLATLNDQKENGTFLIYWSSPKCKSESPGHYFMDLYFSFKNIIVRKHTEMFRNDSLVKRRGLCCSTKKAYCGCRAMHTS